jgi:hypothetical protein
LALRRTREAKNGRVDCTLAEDATASYFLNFKLAAPETIVAQGGAVDWIAPVAAILEAIT